MIREAGVFCLCGYSVIFAALYIYFSCGFCVLCRYYRVHKYSEVLCLQNAIKRTANSPYRGCAINGDIQFKKMQSVIILWNKCKSNSTGYCVLMTIHVTENTPPKWINFNRHKISRLSILFG